MGDRGEILNNITKERIHNLNNMTWDLDGLIDITDKTLYESVFQALELSKSFEDCTRNMLLNNSYMFTTSLSFYDKFGIYGICIKENSIDFYCNTDVLVYNFSSYNLYQRIRMKGLDCRYLISDLGVKNKNTLSIKFMYDLYKNNVHPYYLDNELLLNFKNIFLSFYDYELVTSNSIKQLSTLLSENHLVLSQPVEFCLTKLDISTIGYKKEFTVNQLNDELNSLTPLLKYCNLVLNIHFDDLYQLYRYYYCYDYPKFFNNFVNWFKLNNVKIRCSDLNNENIKYKYHEYEYVMKRFFFDIIV